MKLRFLLTLAVVLGGCTTTSGLIQRDPSQLAPLSPAAQQQVARALAADAKEVQSGRAEVIGTFSKSVQSQDVRQVIAFMRPDALRVEAFITGANQLANIVTSVSGEFRSYDLRNRQYAIGSASLSNALRLLTVPFLPEEFMLWLTGRFPVTVEFVKADFTFWRSTTGDSYDLEASLDDGRNVYARLSPCPTGNEQQRFKVDGLEISDASKRPLFSSVLRYTANADGCLPSTIEVSLPRDGVTGELTVRRLSLNSIPLPPPARLFELQIPETAEVVTLP